MTSGSSRNPPARPRAEGPKRAGGGPWSHQRPRSTTRVRDLCPEFFRSERATMTLADGGQGAGVKTRRIIALIVGCALLLPGLGMLLGGGGLAIAYAAGRDDDGYFAGNLDRVRSRAVPVTTGNIDFGADRGARGRDRARVPVARVRRPDRRRGVRHFLHRSVPTWDLRLQRRRSAVDVAGPRSREAR